MLLAFDVGRLVADGKQRLSRSGSPTGKSHWEVSLGSPAGVHGSPDMSSELRKSRRWQLSGGFNFRSGRQYTMPHRPVGCEFRSTIRYPKPKTSIFHSRRDFSLYYPPYALHLILSTLYSAYTGLLPLSMLRCQSHGVFQEVGDDVKDVQELPMDEVMFVCKAGLSSELCHD